MTVPLTTFAETGGLSALGLNAQSFLFQLITFVIVFVILRQFVFKKLVNTLEARRQAVETSLQQAAETEAKLKRSTETVAAMLAKARAQADEVVAASHKEAAQVLETAEARAATHAAQIVKDAKAQTDADVRNAREALKKETAQLVAVATEQVIRQKLDATQDAVLINDALRRAKDTADG